LDPVRNGDISQRAYDRPLNDVKRRVALDILAEVLGKTHCMRSMKFSNGKISTISTTP
jgi:hypothetical protein